MKSDEKFIISVKETALYEITAEDKEEALEIFEEGGGDFIGWDSEEERVVKIELFDPRS